MNTSDSSFLSETREMSLTLSDFERLLPKVESVINVNKNNNLYDFFYKNQEVKISLERFSERKIASITLPVIFLRFEMMTTNKALFEEFMGEFFKTFQRGGG